jgi:hypothetical protein
MAFVAHCSPWSVLTLPLCCAVLRCVLQRHIAMVVVGFPATALLMSRCRVCISASHSREDLDYALEVRGWTVPPGGGVGDSQLRLGWIVLFLGMCMCKVELMLSLLG